MPPDHIHTNLQYNVKTITRLSELKAGDHIKVNRDKYDHHLLVVKAISDEEVHVIHYADGDEGPRFRFEWPPTRPDMGLITEEVCRINPAKVTVLTFKDLPETLYPPEEAFERARTRLGEKRWELFTNNCEHLVNWALTGVACNSQQDAAKEVGKDFLETALKIGVFAGPVVEPNTTHTSNNMPSMHSRVYCINNDVLVSDTSLAPHPIISTAMKVNTTIVIHFAHACALFCGRWQ